MGPMVAAALGCQASAIRAPDSVGADGRERVPFDPEDITQSTQAFLKLSGSLGNEVVRHWYTGKVYSYIPGVPTQPLFYIDGFYLSTYEALNDGVNQFKRHELTIKRDLNTGDLLEAWKNPFTGRTEIVNNSVGGPAYKLYNQWGFDRPEKARTKDNPLILDWMVFEDEAWVTWDIFTRFKNPIRPERYPLESSGDMLELTNLTNYKGKLSDIEDPNVINAPGVMIWNAISSWQPWMRMSQRPGCLLYKAIGVKVNRFRDMPPQIFDAAEKAYPGQLSEKVPWKEGNYSWFDFVGAEWGQE